MNKLPLVCLASLILCLESGLALAGSPVKIEAEFDVTGFGMTLAHITETFVREGDSYRIESNTKAVGLLARFKPETVRIVSEGKITPQGLKPFDFSMTRQIDTGKNASAKINWDKSIVTHTDYKGINDYPASQGMQDRLSLLYHLPLLAENKSLQRQFAITDGNNIETHTFSISDDAQEIQVPLGTYSARFVTNSPNGEEIRYQIWLISGPENYPCKITVTDSAGGKLTQVLTGLKITP